MNTHLLPSPVFGRILLLVSPDALASSLFEMVAWMALQGPLYILDGGNTFQGYTLARALRRRTPDIHTPMQRVMLSRAFTCYQMAAMLADRVFEPHPILVLDFLATFYDQDVRVHERRRLLQGCIRHMQVLARRSPLAIWVRQRSTIPQEALPFLDMVQNAAGQVWYPPLPLVLPAMKQAVLFA